MKTLPDHFMVSSSDGGLYDTRRANWHTLPPLRPRYEYASRAITNTHELRGALRVPYAWPGGYELYYVTSDGGAICHACARKEYRNISDSIRRNINDGWHVVGVDCVEWREDGLNCDHCGRVIVEGAE